MRSVIACLMLLGGSSLFAQTAAPREVVASAIDAVDKLGKQVVLGNHKAAVDSMYPQWKKRMAKRKGGLEKLEQELDGIGQEMARNGMAITSVKTRGAPRVYEVWPGKPKDGAGADVEPVFDKWLLLVPTVTRLRIMKGDPPNLQVVDIDIHGFQVAIADKAKNNWTFINGSDVSVSDLRSLFASLPANMELPEVKREVVQ